MDIIAKQTLEGNIFFNHKLEGSIASKKSPISGIVAIGGTVVQEPDYYEASYEIEPKTNSQKLDTKNKTMRDDLIIKPIPYYEVSNTANGITVTIGG